MPDWIRSFLLRLFRGHNGDKPLRVIERECDEATSKVRERTHTIRQAKRRDKGDVICPRS